MPANLRVRRVAAFTALAAAAAGALAGAFCAGILVGHGDPDAKPSVLDEAAALLRSRAADPGTTADLNAAAIKGLLSGLDDRWANYYGVGHATSSSNSLQALLDGRYSGLGIWLRRPDNGSRQVVVASVSAGTPAAGAGFRVGDRILAVDGNNVSGQSTDEVAGALRGPAGSTVRIDMAGPGGAVRTAQLARVEVSGAPVMTDVVAPGIVRIRVATFSAGVGAAVAAADRQARATGVRAIVLDLRGNPGGLLDEAVRTASVFLNGGPVVSLQGRSVPQTMLHATPGGDIATPLAVLIDGGTASAAEALAGALSDRDRAVVVGSKSFGKGSVQQTTRLSDGSELEFTVATYRTPDGHAVDGVGIAPDVVVDPAASPTVATDRAVTLLDALVAAAR